jgi:hypothetical protein
MRYLVHEVNMSRLRRLPIAKTVSVLDPRAFIATRVRRDDRYETTNAELYEVYVKDAYAAGLEPGSHRALSTALLAANFRQTAARKDGRIWSCLLLLGTEPQP